MNAEGQAEEKSDDEKRRSSAGAYFAAAEEFHEVVDLIGPSSKAEHAHPRLTFPFCANALQATELYLKAFLLTKEITINVLKYNIGHNIPKALKKAKAEGLPIYECTQKAVYYLYSNAKGDIWRYPKTGYATSPSVRAILEMLDSLKANVFPHVDKWRKSLDY